MPPSPPAAEKQQRRTETQENLLPHGWPLVWRVGVDHHPVVLQLLEQRVVSE